MLLVHSPETKKELKRLCQLEIQILLTEMSLTKLAFNTIWLKVNQKIYQKELNQIEFCEIKHLKLQVIQNIKVIKEDQLQLFTSFLTKNLVEVVLLLLNQIIRLQMNCINRLLEYLRDEKFIIF